MKSMVKDPSLNQRYSDLVRSRRGFVRRPDAVPLVRRRLRPSFRQEWRRNWVLFLMVSPAVVYFLVLSYVPMAGIYLAFTSFDFLGGLFGSDYVGLANFKYLFGSGVLLRLTWNTVVYNLAFIVFSTVAQIGCAIALNSVLGKRSRRFVQSVFLFPSFVSFVLVGSLCSMVLGYEQGFINSTLRLLGAEPVAFYSQQDLWPPVLVLAYVWKTLGYGVVIYLAALSTQNPEYYEAAIIDGASVWDRIRFITVPLLKPTFFVILFFSLATILKGQFELFYQIIGNNGMLFESTEILDTYVYRALRVNFDVGIGTAAGLYQSLFGFLVILGVNQYLRRHHRDYALF